MHGSGSTTLQQIQKRPDTPAKRFIRSTVVKNYEHFLQYHRESKRLIKHEDENMSINSCLNLPGAVDKVGQLAGASLRLLLVIHASRLDIRNALLHLQM
jgi:hypothetical protein